MAGLAIRVQRASVKKTEERRVWSAQTIVALNALERHPVMGFPSSWENRGEYQFALLAQSLS
jgi:hypothetical protein